jgi:pimeloyl-ACP methyl ester carboxylesterase
MAPPAFPMARHDIAIDGTPVAWYESGGGVPIVLIHGIPAGPALWRHVIPQLDEARWLAFDTVGYADSIPTGTGRDLSVARQAEYLLAWLDEFGVDRAVLVGHDLGGGVAQIAAVHAPDRCAGLVVTNATAYDSWPVTMDLAVLDVNGTLFFLDVEGNSFDKTVDTLLELG